MIDEKLKAKLEKLYALTKKGIGGEASNAKEILDKLLQKHNITIDMLTDEERTVYFFNYKTKDEKEILFRIFAVLQGSYSLRYRDVINKKTVGFKLTKYEFIEFCIQKEALFESWRIFCKRAMFAFVFANNLYVQDTQEQDEKTDTKKNISKEARAIYDMVASVPTPNFKRNVLIDKEK